MEKTKRHKALCLTFLVLSVYLYPLIFALSVNIPTPTNFSTIDVNNSLYWNGNLWSDNRWLNIDGSNANTNIDIGSYNLSLNNSIISGQLLGGGVASLGKGVIEVKNKVNNPSAYIQREFDGTGGMSLNSGSQYSGFGLGTYWDTTNWRALSTGIALVYKSPTNMVFYGSDGNTVGNTWTPVARGILDLSTGNWVFGDSTEGSSAIRTLEAVKTTNNGAITVLPTIRALNKQTTGTLSFAGVEVGANNAATNFQIITDGLGGGGVIGERGTYLGMSTNHPLWIMTNSVKRMEIAEDGTINIPFDNREITWGAGGDSSIKYDGVNMLINPKVVGTGKVKILGDLNVTNNFTGNQIYGGMWYTNYTATELNFAVAGTFYQLFMQNATHLNGFGVEGLGHIDSVSNLTTLISGVYQANYMATGDGQNNHEYHTSIFINGVNQLNCDTQHKLAAGGDVLTQTGTCLIDLEVGDRVSLKTADIGGTGTGNYYGANLDLIRIGG